MSEHLREIERLRHEIEQLKARTEQINARTEQLRLQVQETTLREYLRDCHFYLFKPLRIADKSLLCTVYATSVDGKRYPMWLRRWSDFPDIQRYHFGEINRAFGDKRLLPLSSATRAKTNEACGKPVANERDIYRFELFARESPVRRIFWKLVEVEPSICQAFNFTELQFSDDNRELKREGDRGDSEQRVQQPSYPDGLGLRKCLEGDENLAFVYGHKAAHDFRVEDVKPALVKEKLFMEVVQRVNENKTKTDPELTDRDEADEEVAMDLTQVFDYMIQRGVAYGYVAAGKALVFLHVKQDDLRTLYYHLCVPDEEAAGGNGDIKEAYTAVAQLASFCLLALRSEALQGSALNEVLEKASLELQSWPEPYKEADDEDDHQEISSGSDSPPTRQYCTQACLLGLKKGLDLDENCPNVSFHRIAVSSTRHPISTDKFASLVEERLRQNPYRDCVALDPYGRQGKIGAIGALFKIELAQYGYTFVGKGTQPVHLHCLQHESLIYSRLERLQGEVVPVYLGIINLTKPQGYILPGGARVAHMMLMSWAGEVATDVDVPDLVMERKRSSKAVRSEGVYHNDERVPNILWNQERHRVMLIDFDRAALRPAVKHRQLSKLSRIGKKRKSEEDSLEMSGRKCARM
ncbi:hypothetical protein GGR54DRAFT_595860 [Hypoxylon sp. NC1633]|nr:hypothetical protein GGR54DRAFT_595860 [Hypoxylon sp. NC1633]